VLLLRQPCCRVQRHQHCWVIVRAPTRAACAWHVPERRGRQRRRRRRHASASERGHELRAVRKQVLQLQLLLQRGPREGIDVHEGCRERQLAEV
jgi:hypothetical protein